MEINITAYSTALFSTWIFIEELGIVFDVGDGLSSGLLQKSRKIKHAFISHADRDHLAGLIQFNQLNARKGFPKIYYPKHCGSFPALESFLQKFDSHIKGTEWIPISEGFEVSIKGNYWVKAIRNDHVPAAKDISKSLSYFVINKKRKLKAEFENLPKNEIATIAKEKGKEFLSNPVEEKIIGYSADTPVDDYERWDKTKTLIHEATFLESSPNTNNHAHRHSTLEEVMKMVANIEIESLILSHFSSRYKVKEIDQHIKKLIKEYNIKIPVHRLAPGKIHENILNQTPLN
jgi:ribonuclease Z